VKGLGWPRRVGRPTKVNNEKNAKAVRGGAFYWFPGNYRTKTNLKNVYIPHGRKTLDGKGPDRASHRNRGRTLEEALKTAFRRSASRKKV